MPAMNCEAFDLLPFILSIVAMVISMLSAFKAFQFRKQLADIKKWDTEYVRQSIEAAYLRGVAHGQKMKEEK